MLIDQEIIKQHKILRALLNVAKPCEDEETWFYDTKGNKTFGKKLVTLEISDDWKTANRIDTHDFGIRVDVWVHHYKIKGSGKGFKLSENYDRNDKRQGNFWQSYPDAVKHIEEHREWWKNNYPTLEFRGCGAAYCHFCNKFKKTGIVPESI